MITDDELKRINELARKAKNESLTKEEKQEQHHLRQKYLQNIRSSFKNQLKSVKIVDPTGEDVTPKKVKNLKKKDH